MSVTQSIKNALMLHFMLVKRQPFVIAGFLDTAEFAVLKDFVPHCVVHDSLDKAGMGKKDGSMMLAQLVESEAEDLVEGQKNVVMIHNADTEDLQLLTTTFKQAWMASTVIQATELAKKYQVPVYDIKTERWVNIDTSSHDTLWARSLLSSHDGMDLRMAIKDFYHDACMLAAAMLNGDPPSKVAYIVKKYDNGNTRDALMDTVVTYFGINARDFMHGIERPDTCVVEVPPAPATDIPLKKTAPIAIKTLESKSDPFTAEYFFLSKNPTFKRALVKAVNEYIIPGKSFTSPAGKYAYLRGEGAWKGAMPRDALKAILETIVGGCKDAVEAMDAAKAFQTSAVAFKMGETAHIISIITDVLAHSQLPSPKPSKVPLVGGRSWPGADPPPSKAPALIIWLNQTIYKLQAFTAATSRIAKARGLAGAGFSRFVSIPLPKPLEQCTGKELVPWIQNSIENLTAWLDQLQPKVTGKVSTRKKGRVSP
nr:hypothetical protein [Candidatus Sigynarchaeota archaeon]